ncbi:TonB family protein [Pontiella agarivorans]|uniref:TonB family protein n=1 Tax=Pontiella agarivorans TaxID=3038953 RepID=A0ABU5MXH6_9BACT|nr:TonB family protein [Pontiella agarivorans]MDZ8118909.1 TonB family protein [Pontiella agarivorans]
MNRFQRKVALRVLGIHVGVILFFLLISSLKGCFRPKDKPEIVTYIDFGQPAPAVAVQEVEQMQEPEPEPAPAPEPEPEPAPLPEPVKKTLPAPAPKKETPKPKPKEPEKPKWKPTPVDQIKKGKKIKPKAPPKPALSQKDLERLNKVQSKEALPSSSAKPVNGPVGNPNEIAAYDAVIYSTFYNRWDRSGLSPTSRPAQVALSINAAGRILTSRLSQSSGDSKFDAAVMLAVRSVTMLPRVPPRGYDLNNIIINFSITN